MKIGINLVVLAISFCAAIAYGYPSQTVEDVPVNCVWCQMAAFVVEEQILKRLTNETALEILILEGCTAAINGSFCNSTVPGLVKFIWDHKNTSPKLLCELAKICPVTEFTSTVKKFPLLAMEKHLSNDKDVPVNCLWCQLAAYTMEEFLLKRLTNETEIEMVVLEGCTAVINATYCNKTVPGLVKFIWDNRNTSPKLLCELAKICPANELLTKSFVPNSSFDLRLLVADKSVGCTLCRDALELVKLVATQLEGSIEDLVVDYVCDALPTLPRQRCASAVKIDIPAFIDNLNASSICDETKFC